MLRRILLPVGLTALLLVAACGGGETDTSQATNDGSSAFPVSIDTKFGPVTVPEKPERVVAIGWGDAETALALGVQPVGASDWVDFGGDGVGPWADGRYDTPPEIIDTLEPSYEQILALEPDLILDTKSSGDEQRYDRLSAIAPTVGAPEGRDQYKTTIEQQVTMVAQALGEQDTGAELLAGLEKRYAQAAAAHPEFADKTVTVAALSGKGWGAYLPDTERVAFMLKLGFVANPAIDPADADGFSVPVAEENLDLLDADMLVVFPIQRTADDVRTEPLFNSIPAVADGRALVFDDQTIQRSYSVNTILSMDYALDNVVPLIAERISQR